MYYNLYSALLIYTHLNIGHHVTLPFKVVEIFDSFYNILEISSQVNGAFKVLAKHKD